MKNSTTILAIMLLFTVSSFTRPDYLANTGSATTFSEHVVMAIDADTWSDCAGEWVHLTGSIQFLVHGMVNKNRISMVQHGNYQGLTGRGISSGRIYTGSSNFTDVNNASFNGSYTAIMNISVRLRTAGPENNFIYTTRVKTTVNGNGEVTVSRIDEGSHCQ